MPPSSLPRPPIPPHLDFVCGSFPVAGSGHLGEQLWTQRTRLGLQGRPSGSPPGNPSTPPGTLSSLPSSASGLWSATAPPLARGAEATSSLTTHHSRKKVGGFCERRVAPQGHQLPPPHARRPAGGQCELHRLCLLDCPSCPAPAQPSSSALVATDHQAGARAGRGAVAGPRALPHSRGAGGVR